MRRILTAILIFCILGISIPAFSQTGSAFGLKAGFDLWRISERNDDTLWKSIFLPGFSAGFFTEKTLGSIFSFQTELSFLYGRGKSVDPDDETNYVEFKEMFGEVVLMPKFFFELSNTMKYFVYIAPSAAFGIIPYVRNTVSGTPGDWEEESIENWAYKINFSVIFGMGLEISGFILDFRYSLGLIDRNPEELIIRKASRLVFSTGYKF